MTLGVNVLSAGQCFGGSRALAKAAWYGEMPFPALFSVYCNIDMSRFSFSSLAQLKLRPVEVFLLGSSGFVRSDRGSIPEELGRWPCAQCLNNCETSLSCGANYNLLWPCLFADCMYQLSMFGVGVVQQGE